MKTRKLIKGSKLSNRQLNQLIRFFAIEVPAKTAAKTMEINRHSAERVYQVIRRCLASECEKHRPFEGEVEVDESYFGGVRKGMRGRGAAGKVPVFGLLKRNGWVYTSIVSDVSRETLRRIIRTKVVPKAVVYSDSFRSYDGLILDGFKHYRINHGKSFARKRNHINGIENFWSYAKTKLKKYYGINRTEFHYYLKEMEFRFNNRKSPNLSLTIKRIVKEHLAVLD
ncbi:MAG: IS1595 family transposase [Patescibacteria group bacterium]|nr:IS1595 family transposase [Patescibacteria group bacterium]